MRKTPVTIVLMTAALFTLTMSACSGVTQTTDAALSAEAAPSATQLTSPATETPFQPTASPEPTPTPEPTPFSFAWISDTQQYTAKDSDVFSTMTQWIADTREEYNTVLTMHTGDIVYNPYQPYQWENARRAFSLLPKGMRILTSGGNHDMLEKDDPKTTYLDTRPDTDFDAARAFDEQGYAYYTTFTEGGVPFIVFSLSYGHEVAAADWINAICERYPDHYGVLCLHTYVDGGGYSSIGKRIFEKVVKHSANIRLVICGHAHGSAYWPVELDDDGDGKADRTVHEMMFDTQDDLEKGVGFLRILRFHPLEDTIEVVTYSPYLDQFGYKYVGGDRFGEVKILEDAGLSDFLTRQASDTK